MTLPWSSRDTNDQAMAVIRGNVYVMPRAAKPKKSGRPKPAPSSK